MWSRKLELFILNADLIYGRLYNEWFTFLVFCISSRVSSGLLINTWKSWQELQVVKKADGLTSESLHRRTREAGLLYVPPAIVSWP
jgi:hypothetical protein